MDRTLQIALVAAALALLWGYALQQRLRAGAFFGITRTGHAGLYWCLMIGMTLVEAGFVALTVTSVGAWLAARP